MQKIQDYGIIGNGRSAALVSLQGSIDWLCWPRFDSPSLFASILDDQSGGSWKIAPVLEAKISRQYIEGTNVLQTRFLTNSGTLVITDFMPAFSEKDVQQSLQPEQEIIRRVECEDGEVEIQIAFDPKPNYGQDKIVIKDGKALGLRLEVGSQLFTLRSDVNFELTDTGAYAKVKLKAKQRLDFSLTFTGDGPAILSPLGDPITQKMSLTINWWQTWIKQITYNGPYKNQVIRSALVLKLLGCAPSGSFIAALTTSLPERIGGDMNWDYRFCWLRDAAFTVRALYGLGIKDEAEAFVSWLLHSTRLTLPELGVLYDIYGNETGNDKSLTHFKGYKGSSPVRIGNGARGYFELDVYGEVIEAVTHLVRSGSTLDRETQKVLSDFGKYVCKNWQKPDTGIWEEMHPLKHYTHSKLMCWVALDRLIELEKRGQLKNAPIDTFVEHHRLIRKDIEDKGWNSKIQSYTQVLEGETLDAAVLTMPLYEFDEVTSERMTQTYQRLQERLSPTPGLLYRFEKSLEMGEGTFGLCSFWSAEFLARGGGSLEDAHQAFNQILIYTNDLGLFAEEIDPKSGDALGNFPQAFTHVGLINTALSLQEREKQKGSL